MPLQGPSCLVIDGQALVMALGKPPETTTFGDYANKFTDTVLKMGAKYQRVDVVFDRYHDESIKTESVPLPADWSSFMALEENKADLAQLLSNHLIEHSPDDEVVVVVSGGVAEATTVKSSDPNLEVSSNFTLHPGSNGNNSRVST